MDSKTGQFVSHEEFEKLSDNEKKYYIDTSASARDMFEDQETERKMQYESEQLERSQKNRGVGTGRRRNKPCPCGSGKKYKKCCLKVLA